MYIVKNKEEQYFFSDDEFNAAKNVKGVIQRCKGLGSLSPEQAKRSMFTKEYQRLDTIIPDEQSFDLLEQLMGVDIQPRRDFIFSKVDFSEIHE